MTISRSQGYCEAAQSAVGNSIIIVGTDIALVNSTTDTVTRVTADFVSSGIVAGDLLQIRGATASADDIDAYIDTVAAGTLTLKTDGETFTTGETAGAKITLIVPRGGSFRALMNGGQLTLFSGSKPTTADASKGGATALFEFDDIEFAEDGTWSSTSKYSRMELEVAMSATCLADGTVGWFRFTGPGQNRDDASTTAIRWDGTVGTVAGSYDLVLTQTDWEVGDTLNLSVSDLVHDHRQA